MDDIQKLRVLIPHWMEHNEEHALEFQRWAETAGDATADLLAAVETLGHVIQILATALEKLGGALPHQHSH